MKGANITQDRETGIGAWSDADLKRLMVEGVRPSGVPIAPQMPYAFYKILTPRDLDAIVAYLRTIAPVKNAVQPPVYKAAMHLSCDNLLSVDVVTAEGQLVTASTTQNPDLLWGVRGGGGNFGVITSFEYRLHPLEPILAGMIAYPWERAREFLGFALECSTKSSDELTMKPALLTLQDGTRVAAVNLCHCGPVSGGERLVHRLRSFGTPLFDSVQPISYVGLQSMLDAGLPLGHRHYWKSSFVRRLRDEAIGVMVDFMARKPSSMTFAYLQHAHGATIRVEPSDTAFAHRTESYDFAIISQWSDPTSNERNVAWTREFFEAMRDPTNFFRMNQNISPS